MFPIRDTVRASRFPIMNWLLIGANVAVFVLEINMSPALRNQLIQTFGMVPERLNLADPILLLRQPVILIILFTSQFLHGGWLHLISNMWTLFIFGDNVEDRMGPGRYLIFYLLSGMVANLMQAFVFKDSMIPAIGASGAIAGVLGAYLLLFPRARVVTLIILFIFPWFVDISALFFIGFWFVSQLYSGVFALRMPSGAEMAGIAWWAHIGGFLFGLLVVNLFARRPRQPTYQRQ